MEYNLRQKSCAVTCTYNYVILVVDKQSKIPPLWKDDMSVDGNSMVTTWTWFLSLNCYLSRLNTFAVSYYPEKKFLQRHVTHLPFGTQNAICLSSVVTPGSTKTVVENRYQTAREAHGPIFLRVSAVTKAHAITASSIFQRTE